MTAFAAVMASLTAIGATVTATVAIIRRLVDPTGAAGGDSRFPLVTWQVLALIVGVAYCLGWQLNLAPAFVGLVPALVTHASRLSGVAGQTLTGLAAGAVAGFFHDTFSFVRSHTK